MTAAPPQTPAPLGNLQQVVAALRGVQAPQAHPVTNYTPQLPNLNPNLAKEAFRVQQIASGQAKPNSASWG